MSPKRTYLVQCAHSPQIWPWSARSATTPWTFEVVNLLLKA